jgi:uncharacterized protein (TIGR00251 family)
MPPIQETPEGVLLTVHIQAKASRTEFIGLHGEALKIRVAAPPLDGAANEALCLYLASRFGLAKQSVNLRSGASSRHKRVLLRGVSAERVRQIFALKT